MSRAPTIAAICASSASARSREPFGSVEDSTPVLPSGHVATRRPRRSPSRRSRNTNARSGAFRDSDIGTTQAASTAYTGAEIEAAIASSHAGQGAAGISSVTTAEASRARGPTTEGSPGCRTSTARSRPRFRSPPCRSRRPSSANVACRSLLNRCRPPTTATASNGTSRRWASSHATSKAGFSSTRMAWWTHHSTGRPPPTGSPPSAEFATAASMERVRSAR